MIDLCPLCNTPTETERDTDVTGERDRGSYTEACPECGWSKTTYDGERDAKLNGGG